MLDINAVNGRNRERLIKFIKMRLTEDKLGGQIRELQNERDEVTDKRIALDRKLRSNLQKGKFVFKADSGVNYLVDITDGNVKVEHIQVDPILESR